MAPYPDLPFLAFLEKARKTTQKKQGFFHYAEPLKSLGKKGKTLKKSKERKIRVLRDTARLSQRYPPIRAMGFLVSQHGQLGAIPPSPFSERFPLGEHAKWRCVYPPRKRGISAILARYPMKTRQMGAIPPSAILSRKGIARYGGVSRTGLLSAARAAVSSVWSHAYGTAF